MVTKKLTDVIALMHAEFQVPVVLSFTAVLVRTSEDACLSRNILLRFENENGDFLKRISVVRSLDRLLFIGNIPEKKLG